MIEKLFSEIEILLSDIAFTGLRNVQPVTLRRLEELKRNLAELNMLEGSERVGQLVDSFTRYKQGGRVEDVADALCALECYAFSIKKLTLPSSNTFANE